MFWAQKEVFFPIKAVYSKTSPKKVLGVRKRGFSKESLYFRPAEIDFYPGFWCFFVSCFGREEWEGILKLRDQDPA